MYGLAFLPEALTEWNALDKGVRTKFKNALEKRLKIRLFSIVIVVAIGKREDLAVYKASTKRRD